MKKVLFMIICMFSLNIVNASGAIEMVPVTNRCSVVKDNKIVVPVDVVVTRDGIISNLIEEYTFGYIDNGRDTMIVNINDIEGYLDVKLDHNRDSEGRSLFYYSTSEDLELRKNDIAVSFKINVEFLEEVPDTYYLFGNEIVISEDEDVCELINGYQINEIERIVYIDSSDDNHSCMVTYIILFILVIVILVLSILLYKRKK